MDDKMRAQISAMLGHQVGVSIGKCSSEIASSMILFAGGTLSEKEALEVCAMVGETFVNSLFQALTGKV